MRKKHNIATLATFLEAWRVEVPWLVVCKSVSMFTRCSVCEYLRLLIDQTPRDQDELRQALNKYWAHTLPSKRPSAWRMGVVRKRVPTVAGSIG